MLTFKLVLKKEYKIYSKIDQECFRKRNSKGTKGQEVTLCKEFPHHWNKQGSVTEWGEMSQWGSKVAFCPVKASDFILWLMRNSWSIHLSEAVFRTGYWWSQLSLRSQSLWGFLFPRRMSWRHHWGGRWVDTVPPHVNWHRLNTSPQHVLGTH